MLTLASVQRFGVGICVLFVFVQAIKAGDEHDLAYQMALERLASPQHLTFMKFVFGLYDSDVALMDEAFQDRPELVHTSIVPPGFEIGIHPFDFALRANSSDAVLAWLLDRGVALDAPLQETEYTPLTLAIAMGKNQAVELLKAREGKL